jgi:hypothetical protein
LDRWIVRRHRWIASSLRCTFVKKYTPISCPSSAQVDTVIRFYEFMNYEHEDTEGFWPRDVCVIWRMKGHVIANHLDEQQNERR